MSRAAANQNAAADPELTEPRAAASRLLTRLFRLGWRYRGACLTVAGLQTLIVIMTVAGLRLAGLGIDFVRWRHDPGSPAPQWPLGIAPPESWSSMGTLAVISAGVLCTATLLTGVRFAAALATASLSQRVLVRLRTDVYDKLQRLSFRFFDTAETSSLINRAAGDVQAVRTFVDGVIVRVLSVFLSLTVYLAYMLSVHVPLTIACLFTSPLLGWGAVMFSRIVRPEYRRSSQLGDQLITTLAENIQGIHVVKGFAREDLEVERFRAANARVRDQKQRIFRQISTWQPLMGALTQTNMLILIGFGGYLVVRGEMPLGIGLFVFANLLHEFANQVGQITNIANTVQASLIGAERVFEVLDTPIEIRSPPGAVSLSRARGAIRLDHVSFAYRNSEPVLQDVSLEVAPGECVGIVGETGAGKSTLLSLLPRFYDVQAGTVSIDGHDVRNLNPDELRRNIGIVFQESFLFSNTVAANIAFGHPHAPREAVERAARVAAADPFIRELALGYETVIGEHGSDLSGGQRQRLAIARALLPDPPILLLDDATASVDAHTEHEIQEAIDSAMHGRTTILVSSRISSLRRADRIVVLQNGQVIQVGTHEDLLRTPGWYRRLAELQFADLATEPSDPSAEENPALCESDQ